MCGIFGIIAKEKKYNKKELVRIFEDIAKLSQVRGKDSSGLAYRFESKKQIDVLKGPVSIDELLKTKEYEKFKEDILNDGTWNVFAALGHARLVTNGTQLEDVNNQPVVKDGIVGIHNGIIVNEEELWSRFPELKREYEIDTEVIYTLFRHHLTKLNNSIEAIKQTNDELFGTVSTGFFINDLNEFLCYTNNGSLYILTNEKDFFIYGSEKNILLRLVKKNKIFFNSDFIIKQVPANQGYFIDYKDFSIIKFDLTKEGINSLKGNKSIPYKIDISNYHPQKEQLHAVVDSGKFSKSVAADSEKKLLEYKFEKIAKLKRCTKCILPETFPFIEFDEKGVCNICNNYVKKNQPKQINELQELVEPYRSKDRQPDCLIPFSGGRDSTYVLHIVKNILKMNPIAFTYDWGMVTDLGRRNIARVTGKMGVENIIVSADIRMKRSNIRKNVTAWLKKPELGLVPLFMSGDKYFFYYANKISRQNNLKISIWGSNPLENTNFKTGFCGIRTQHNKERIDSISLKDKIKLLTFFGKNYIMNPSYINSSLIDTAGSFFSRYLIKRIGYVQLFDYYFWDEKEIEKLIHDEYRWETAIDTQTTWRIGDGTAAFYNYIYFTVTGFSEYDTFRSNQIREGMLIREEALKLVEIENLPRYESLKWYLEIIGLDFQSVIKKINNIYKLY